MDIVYNCSHHARSISCFYECNAVEVLTKFAKETEYIGGNRVNVAAILTLASVIDDRNNHLIIPDSGRCL